MKPAVFLMILVTGLVKSLWSITPGDTIAQYELDEIVIFNEYPFENDKEKAAYAQMEKNVRVVFPLVKIVASEYERVNQEMLLYDKKRRKVYLKWYENYAKEHYMPMLSGLSHEQGRLFLKLINRETGESPYQLIRTYRNGFRAIFWQGAAWFYGANLRTEYQPEENQMIEHIIKKLVAEEAVVNKKSI